MDSAEGSGTEDDGAPNDGTQDDGTQVDGVHGDGTQDDSAAEVAPHVAPAPPPSGTSPSGEADQDLPAAEAPSDAAPAAASTPATIPLTPVKESAAATNDNEAPAPGPGASAEPPRVILLRLDATNVEPATVKVIQGLFTSAASRQPRVDVVTVDDLSKSIDLEAERQTLSCDDEAVDSCLAEIAGAMGARYIAYGQVGRLGDLTLLQLHLFDSDRARSINRVDLKVDDVQDLAELMDDAVGELFAPLTGEVAESTSLAGPIGGTLLGVAAASLVVAVAGGLTFGTGLVLARLTHNRSIYDPAYADTYAQAWLYAVLGTGGSVIGIGAVLLAAGFAATGAAAFFVLE